MTKICPKCGKTKKLHLFSKNTVWCKLCSKRWKETYLKDLKETDFHKWKAKQFRSNWRRRAKAFGNDVLNEVPTVPEIIQWLNKQTPYVCYFTGEKLGREFGVDHIVPIARGGSFKLDNLCLTHPFINGAKGAMTGNEFKKLLKLIYTWEDKGKDILRRLRSSNTMFGGKK